MDSFCGCPSSLALTAMAKKHELEEHGSSTDDEDGAPPPRKKPYCKWLSIEFMQVMNDSNIQIILYHLMQ